MTNRKKLILLQKDNSLDEILPIVVEKLARSMTNANYSHAVLFPFEYDKDNGVIVYRFNSVIQHSIECNFFVRYDPNHNSYVPTKLNLLQRNNIVIHSWDLYDDMPFLKPLTEIFVQGIINARKSFLESLKDASQ